MTKTFIYIIVFVCGFLFSQTSYSQSPLENEIEVFGNATDAEKIYLQLSGTTFNTSETIWFKAIVTDVKDHKPTIKSGVLHVELIDPLDNQIVDESLLKINGGVCNGFFQLNSNYREGNYMVRAYTEWNKNFGSDFISSNPIKIYRLQKIDAKPNPIKDIVFRKDQYSNTFSLSSTVAVKELDSLHSGDAILYMHWKDVKDSILLKSRKTKSEINVQHEVPLDVPIINYRLKTKNEEFTKSIVLDDEYGSLQFFPEGGYLVEGLKSVVGFKYLNYKGKGVKIHGTIVDKDTSIVAEFESNAFGMGKITLTPEAEQTYHGVLTTDSGNTFKYELPKARKTGQVLSLIDKGTKKELRIWNKENNKDSVFIKLFHRGRNLFFLKSRFRNGVFLYRINPNDLPHGVIGLTVFDKSYRPVAERHFFNERKEENVAILVETDKDRYSVRDSVQVSISTRQNGEPIPASVSVMAIDSSYFYNTNLDRNTIVSYFLLQSDIKGTIENPSYYFENSKNMNELDYLMLTQGWTNYKYREKKKTRLFEAEKGLEIRGRVDDIHRVSKTEKSRKRNYELNMLFMGDSNEAYSLKTDTTGYFKLDLPDSYGLGSKFVIQPSDASNKKGDLKINIKEYKAPEIAYKTEKVIIPVDSIIEKKMIQKIEEDIELDPFLLPNTITLSEVEISNYKVTPERSEMFELHGMPDAVIDDKELLNRRENWTENIYKWLLFNYPSEIRVKRVRPVGNMGGFEVANVLNADFTYVVIDGVPVHLEDYRLIGNIRIDVIKSIEIIRNSRRANTYYLEVFDCAPICPPPQFPAILAIYTYSGKGLYAAFPRLKNTNLINGKAPQFSPTREFYMPEYAKPSKIDWNIPDRRTLLYWNPNIVTNRNRPSEMSFFNGDLTGKMLLVCEAITINGHVMYSELLYEVDDR